MLKNYILVILCFSKMLFSMHLETGHLETEQHLKIKNQAQLNEFSAEQAISVYGEINNKVKFSQIVQTSSKYWDIIQVVGTNLLFKKKGVPLSEALKDLIKPEKTMFDCGTAQCVWLWTIFCKAFKADEIISTFENNDENFRFYLVSEGIYGYLNANKNMYNGTNNFLSSFPKIKPFWDCLVTFPQDSTKLPLTTELGGFLYLHNIEGMKETPQKGQNLVCVTKSEEKDLYIGFSGDGLFKEGAKSLNDIAENLKEAAVGIFGELGYIQQIVPGLQHLNNQLTSLKLPKVNTEKHHPLLFKTRRDLCCCLNINKIESVLKKHKK